MPVHLQKNSANVSRRHRLKNAVLGLRKKLWSRWGRFQILFGLWRTFCDKGIPPLPHLAEHIYALRIWRNWGFAPHPPLRKVCHKVSALDPKKFVWRNWWVPPLAKDIFGRKTLADLGGTLPPPLFFLEKSVKLYLKGSLYVRLKCVNAVKAVTVVLAQLQKREEKKLSR